MINSGKFRAGLWIMRNLPGRRTLHKLAYSPNMGNNVHIGYGSCIIGENVHIGSGVKLGNNTTILGKEIFIGDNVTISDNVQISCKKIKIGCRTRIDARCTIGGLPTPRSELVLGNDVWVFEDCYLNTSCKLTIGNGTGIGGWTMIWTHGSWQSVLDGYPIAFADTTLGENVWLPWHIIIMPGITIGSGATLGAGSVVTRDIPAKSLALGAPAKVVKDSTTYPHEPSKEEKRTIASKIIDEFTQSLNETYSIKSIIKKNDPFVIVKDGNSWNIASNNNKWNIVLVSSEDQLHNQKPNLRTILLSIDKLDANIMNKQDDFFGVVDLSNRNYICTKKDEVFDELISVLGHYGVRMHPYTKSLVR